ncbi:MAG: YajD family HNH nuclease [Desulfobacteraceae bacterium]|nr:YajD family HNH nuclease [Pseudomonadota bacterium]MBU4463958.1 YajD family HNH nuclease [Pseudomonadota bacterium]MCG2754278.1 YajD family HNH nuclease [Desulfobacteraceae bacterium]
MPPKKTQAEDNKQDQSIAKALRERELREKTYREQALKLYPWVCARCGREFTGKRLRELTIHHRDHDHENNPPDGSNWELLCLYCHDNEHSRYLDAEHHNSPPPGGEQEPPSTYRPFAGLETLLKDKE